jgi:hypothetical protein
MSIKKALLESGVSVIYYHGENALCEEDGLTQQDLKDEHFADVNKYWTKYSVVLHTSTVTAGISFDLPHFDIQINVFNAKTCDAGSFFQGSHRVRHLSTKRIITFIQQEYV